MGLVDYLADVANNWGITCPSEYLSGRIACLCFAMDKDTPNPSKQHLKDKKEDVRSAIKKAMDNTPFPFEHIPKYPRNPNDLSEDLKTYALKGDAVAEPPPGVVEKVNTLLGRKFLRVTKRDSGTSEPAVQQQQQSPFGRMSA